MCTRVGLFGAPVTYASYMRKMIIELMVSQFAALMYIAYNFYTIMHSFIHGAALVAYE